MVFACVSAHAQQIWTEGTSWEVHIDYSDWDGHDWTEVHIYELGEPVSFNDTIYYTLSETCAGATHIVSYLRAEGGDAYVYARHFQSEELRIDTGEQSEILLYDFSKPFEYGDSIRYATYGGWIEQDYIDPEWPTLRYLHDVIEPGDCLPMFHDIIYKFGSIYGPIGKIYLDFSENTTGFPNTKNVSHVLFKTKGKPNGSMITLRIDIVHNSNSQPYSCYSLTGIQSPHTNNQILFRKNNVLLMR